MDAAALRREFPVLERIAYLNAGTDGPVPSAGADAARAALRVQEASGRYREHFEARAALAEQLRGAYAAVLDCSAEDVAVTTSASDGLGRLLAGLDLGPGDEVVTGEDEHPGLIGPLLVARMRGARVRPAPLASIASAVTDATTLVACSHVSWMTGEVVDPALRDVGVPVILDGAQGAGAVPVDLDALGADAYAAAGQKWLCGADGTGLLYVSPALRERARPVTLAHTSLADPGAGFAAQPHPSARRFDTASLARELLAFSVAAHAVLDAFGLDAVSSRARGLAAGLASALAERGYEVAPRGDTTLVSWRDADPEATAGRLGEAGVVVRFLPGHPLVRAAVGAWNDESDLERLLARLSRR